MPEGDDRLRDFLEELIARCRLFEARGGELHAAFDLRAWRKRTGCSEEDVRQVSAAANGLGIRAAARDLRKLAERFFDDRFGEPAGEAGRPFVIVDNTKRGRKAAGGPRSAA